LKNVNTVEKRNPDQGEKGSGVHAATPGKKFTVPSSRDEHPTKNKRSRGGGTNPGGKKFHHQLGSRVTPESVIAKIGKSPGCGVRVGVKGSWGGGTKVLGPPQNSKGHKREIK